MLTAISLLAQIVALLPCRLVGRALMIRIAKECQNIETTKNEKCMQSRTNVLVVLASASESRDGNTGRTQVFNEMNTNVKCILGRTNMLAVLASTSESRDGNDCIVDASGFTPLDLML